MGADSPAEISRRLRGFLKPLLPLFGRSERGVHASFYVSALLMDQGRKTPGSIAARYGGDTQSLQQFVSQSPWDHEALRRASAKAVLAKMDSQTAWIVDDTGFAKKGDHSVGVARQYSGTLGRIGNCQVGVSLSCADTNCSVPVDFELYLPETWCQDEGRRDKAGIPKERTFKKKWEIALELIDRARGWGLVPGVVTADAGYGAVKDFRKSLADRSLSYQLAVSKDTAVWAPPSARGKGMSVFELAQSLSADPWKAVTWREGSKGPLTGRFAALRVLPSHAYVGRTRKKESECWLLIEWPDGAKEPEGYHLSNLGESTPIESLVYWAKARWYVEQNYQQLKSELGLDQFEGRSYQGWHHHVTLTMIAFHFLTMERLRVKKNYWVDAASD